MKTMKLIKAALLGCALFGAAAMPALSQDLRVMEGSSPSSALNVPMSRAVVVESQRPFAEISVANADIADISTLSDSSIYVLGRTPGRTTMTLLAADGSLIANVQIQVTPDITEFKERLQQIMPNEKIDVRTANDGVVLSGVVSSITQMDRVMVLADRYAPGRASNLMSIGGTQQVMLKVRFAEMSRSVSKNLSSSINAISAGGGALGSNSTTGTFLSPDNTSANIATNGGLTTKDDTLGAFSIGASLGATQLSVLIEALEEKGVVRTLAEPNLTALSGQEASFLAGGEYPVPVSDEDGIYIDYKPFGVELEFTPRVVDGDQINLEMRAAVSGIDSTVNYTVNGFTLNSFKRRETATTVELRDGQSFAVAGLLQDDFEDLVGQVPWLGDIPVLGALFRSADYSRRQSELVIIVTPHLVTPVSGDTLAVPTDRVRVPSENELFLFGRTSATARGQQQVGGEAEVAKQDFTGSYGYVMEE